VVVLRAEYAKMCIAGERLQKLCRKLARHLEDMKKSVDRLELAWDGEANAAFLLRTEGDFFKLYLLQESAQAAADFLLSAVEEYQKTEFIIEQKIGGIRI